ncbi:MAG: tetratricopeptide repeat protein, partial [Candidatus Omnitrophica bacterium]|nr:tetratricopeptide repeat protein [Candidatus Omnitrophota bacterium]
LQNISIAAKKENSSLKSAINIARESREGIDGASNTDAKRINELTGSFEGQNIIIMEKEKEITGLKNELEILRVQNKELQNISITSEKENSFVENTSEIAQEKLKSSKKVVKKKSKDREEKSLDPRDAKLLEVNKSLKKEVEELKEILTVDSHKLGEIYTQQKLYKKAVNAYEKALKYNPNNYQSCYHLGLLYAYMEKNPKEALTYLRKFLKLTPEEKNKQKAARVIELLEK